MNAKLIGERSAGMTAVEIYDDNDNLVWSHEYFTTGASHQGYVNGLCQVLDDLVNCQDVDNYEGCDRDDDGDVIPYDTGDTTGIILEYNGGTKQWIPGTRYGQSDEILDALMSLGIIPQDASHDVDATIQTIADYYRLPR